MGSLTGPGANRASVLRAAYQQQYKMKFSQASSSTLASTSSIQQAPPTAQSHDYQQHAPSETAPPPKKKRKSRWDWIFDHTPITTPIPLHSPWCSVLHSYNNNSLWYYNRILLYYLFSIIMWTHQVKIKKSKKLWHFDLGNGLNSMKMHEKPEKF